MNLTTQEELALYGLAVVVRTNGMDEGYRLYSTIIKCWVVPKESTALTAFFEFRSHRDWLDTDLFAFEMAFKPDYEMRLFRSAK